MEHVASIKARTFALDRDGYDEADVRGHLASLADQLEDPACDIVAEAEQIAGWQLQTRTVGYRRADVDAYLSRLQADLRGHAHESGRASAESQHAQTGPESAASTLPIGSGERARLFGMAMALGIEDAVSMTEEQLAEAVAQARLSTAPPPAKGADIQPSEFARVLSEAHQASDHLSAAMLATMRARAAVVVIEAMLADLPPGQEESLSEAAEEPPHGAADHPPNGRPEAREQRDGPPPAAASETTPWLPVTTSHRPRTAIDLLVAVTHELRGALRKRIR
jgi:hypothetical protein